MVGRAEAFTSKHTARADPPPPSSHNPTNNQQDQDLKKYLDACEGGLEPAILRSFLYQLLHGVAYCHDHRVLHRCVK